ncbi:MAG: ABC transporter ATP-binding protein [Gemmatimonadaceae bacterium]
MSSDLAITVDHLSKSYRLHGRRQRYNTIRDSIMETVASPFRKARNSRNGQARKTDKHFLALNDISFEIPRGEAVGVMGHNGAGKSTLLKILSRITEPSSGSATLFGRVGSLLEVGTGFHLELSGRENIYLSGAIIGMKKAEIDKNFDEIVDFAEVEEFIDTPVKHYSSGMHLRLAFAVAAYLQPEILLIDEVLAVGDARFQRKCLGKMDDVAASGRTVLFVSHNLSAVKELCRTGIVLSHGQLLIQAPIVEAIAKYTESTQEQTVAITGAGWRRLEMVEPASERDWIVQAGNPMTFRATLALMPDFGHGAAILLIHDSTGALLVHQRAEFDRQTISGAHSDCLEVSASLPPLWLAPGLYTVHFKFLGRLTRTTDTKYVSERRILDVRGWSKDRANAALAPACKWSLKPLEVEPSLIAVGLFK